MGPWCSKVEGVVIDSGFWKGRRIFLTGHTGFKGAWMALLLRSLGAEIFGFALPPENRKDGLFTVARIEHDLAHCEGDLRDLDAVEAAVSEGQPEIIIHMAAQALVRRSYADPVTTYASNVLGTVHLLESVRRTPCVKAVIIVTSDKCYDNRNSIWGYREIDPLGGHDPYSSSKGCTELVVDSYRRSFFDVAYSPSIASARAGNVIGGGDWAEDRIVPDAMRAFLQGEPLRIRNPAAVRPWQHVLDPLVAYLLLAERLYTEGKSAAEGWNFGPPMSSDVPVASIADALVRLWGTGAQWMADGGEHPHESPYLRLDCSKAFVRLGWRPLLDLENSLRLTVDWYRQFQGGADMRAVTLAQIEQILKADRANSMRRNSLATGTPIR
jgi:CDP-glucose 4,6-dehydratase